MTLFLLQIRRRCDKRQVVNVVKESQYEFNDNNVKAWKVSNQLWRNIYEAVLESVDDEDLRRG